MKDAAGQLKELAGSGFPLVVVLANPHGVPLDLRPQMVGCALDGNPTFGGPVNRDTGAVE